VTAVRGHEAAIGSAAYRRERRAPRSRQRPRILELLATGSTGGAQQSYTSLLLGLARDRYDVRAVSLSRGTAVERLRRLGIDVDVIDAEDDAEAVRELAAYLRRHEIDVVHSHMFRAEVVGTRAALAAGTPVVVATVHSSRVRSARDTATLRELTPHVDRLIVPSRAIATKVRAERGPDARCVVVPNGVDLRRFAAVEPCCTLHAEFRIPTDALLVGVVARLEPEKGHRHLLDAMPEIIRRAPRAWLLVVGDGSLADPLRRHAASLPADVGRRITFTGPRDDVAAVTAALDIAVLPSLREAQGISILEAMAVARPVVATRVGGIPEVITDGVEGLLVSPADPAALAVAVGRLARNPPLRRRIGRAGQRTVEERFSIDAMVRRIEAIYDTELMMAGRAVHPSAASALHRRLSMRRRPGRAPASRAVLEVPPFG
jgi:L-malate glycosyltransferase